MGIEKATKSFFLLIMNCLKIFKIKICYPALLQSNALQCYDHICHLMKIILQARMILRLQAGSFDQISLDQIHQKFINEKLRMVDHIFIP